MGGMVCAMPRLALLAPLLLVQPLLSGCLAKAAFDVATAPVKVAGKAVDMATTSQSERDERRGRELREREERYGKLERQYGKALEECRDGDEDDCRKAEQIHAEMDALRPGIPAGY